MAKRDMLFRMLAGAGIICVTGGPLLAEAADGQTEPAVPAAGGDESVMVAELFAENRGLRGRLEEKEREVEALQRQLAETMAQLDLARVPEVNRRTAEASAPVANSGVAVDDIARVRVLDVNRDMQVAVVSGGAGAGMKAGMRFYVLRDDRMIAQLKLVDVREHVAGGLIERVEKGNFPEAGDRVMLSSKQDG